MHLTLTEKCILNAFREGIMIIDTQARIVFANEAYRRFLQKEGGKGMSAYGFEEDALTGRRLCEVRPGARLPEVLKTGTPLRLLPRKEDEETYFVNMYPIYDGSNKKNSGRVDSDPAALIGAVSLVTFKEDAAAIAELLQQVKLHGQQMLGRMNPARMTFAKWAAKAPASAACRDLARRLAPGRDPLLITGEAGSGKDALAQAVHNASDRSSGPYTSVRCDGLSARTLGEELFGNTGVPGGMKNTGNEGRIGLFEAAEGGTVVLDAITRMPIQIQSKVVQMLDTGTIRASGSMMAIPVDVRIIALTSEDPGLAVKEGRLLQDLYYRLNAFQMTVPPLREHMTDLPVLVRRQLEELSLSLHRPVRIDDEALARLKRHSWPGNIRELNNVLSFAALRTADGLIRSSDLPPDIGEARLTASGTLPERVRRFEAEQIRQTLALYGDDLKGKRAAAEALGISLASLYNKLGEKTNKHK